MADIVDFPAARRGNVRSTRFATRASLELARSGRRPAARDTTIEALRREADARLARADSGQVAL